MNMLKQVQTQLETKLMTTEENERWAKSENQELKTRVLQLQQTNNKNENRILLLTEEYKQLMTINMKLTIQNQKLEKIVYGEALSDEQPIKKPKRLKTSKSAYGR